jgi:hypothetical protein
MGLRYPCDECGSMDDVAHLKVYAEVSSSYFKAEGERHLVSLPAEDADDPPLLPEYEGDLCNSCLNRRIVDLCNFLGGFKKRLSK